MDYDYLLNSVTALGIIIYFIITFINIYFLLGRIKARNRGNNVDESSIIFMYMCISILPAYILHLLI